MRDDGHEAGLLVPAIRHLLERRLAEASEEVVKQATAEFEKRLRSELARAALDVSSFYDLQRDGGNLIITVKDYRTK